jgi:hypothetical protein
MALQVELDELVEGENGSRGGVAAKLRLDDLAIVRER